MVDRELKQYMFNNFCSFAIANATLPFSIVAVFIFFVILITVIVFSAVQMNDDSVSVGRRRDVSMRYEQTAAVVTAVLEVPRR